MTSNVILVGKIKKLPFEDKELIYNHYQELLMYVSIEAEDMNHSEILVPVRIWPGDAEYLERRLTVDSRILISGRLIHLYDTQSTAVFLEKFEIL